MLSLKRHILTQLKSGDIHKSLAAEWIQSLNNSGSASAAALSKKGLTNARVISANEASTVDSTVAVYSIALTGDEFFLTDHRVFGEKVLPGVAYLELVNSVFNDFQSANPAIKIQQLNDSVSNIFTDVTFLAPVKVKEKSAAELIITLKCLSDQNTEFSVISYEESSDVLHAQGKIKISDETQSSTTIDLLNLKESTSTPISIDRLYSVFSKMGVEYGPGHQSVTQIEVNKSQNFAIAQVKLPSSVVGNSLTFDLHPSLMDGALQVAIALDLENFSESHSPIVPFSLASATIHTPLIQQEYFVVAKERSSTYNSEPQQRNEKVFDFTICDKEGQICVEMNGFYARVYNSNSQYQKRNQKEHQKKSSNLSTNTTVNSTNSNKSGQVPELTGSLVLAPEWTKIDLDNDLDLNVQSPLNHLLVIGGVEQQVCSLKNLSHNLDRFEVTHDSLESITPELLADELKQYPSLSNIIWFVEPTNNTHSLNHIVRDQDKGALFGLCLIKALVALGFDASPLNLTVVTRQTVSVRGEQNYPTHATLQGLFGSLSKEFDHWSVQHIDLGSDDDLSAEKIVQIENIESAKADTLLPIRQGTAYKPGHIKLANDIGDSINTTIATNSQFVSGGVYVLFGGAGGLGELFSEYLITQYKAQVIWVGRRKINSDIQAKLDRLSLLDLTFPGIKPEYHCVDTQNLESLSSFVRELKNNHKTINGVIHTAMVLNDGSITNMGIDKFRSSLSPKVDLSINIAEAFAEESLDFMLFFSSLQSSFCAPGQSNYAAGSTFIDAFAAAYRNQVSYPVKVINWGYWGNVGIVASDFYRSRMEAMGIEAIDSARATEIIEALLASECFDQLAYIETSKDEIALSINVNPNEQFTIYSWGEESHKEEVSLSTIDINEFPVNISEYQGELDKLNNLIAQLLLCQLLDSNFSNLQGNKVSFDSLVTDNAFSASNSESNYLQGWLEQSIHLLLDKGLLSSANTDPSDYYLISNDFLEEKSLVWQRWKEFKAQLEGNSGSYQGINHKLNLIEETLEKLSGVLSGEISPVQVIFPQGGLSLVEGLYKNNEISDYYNDVLASKLKEALEQKVEQRSTTNHKIRLLEVGAGSGGTSERVFTALADVSNAIEEYCYTDLSQVFLQHAQQNYSEVASYLRCSIFDVAQPVESQDFELGSYDFVVATNVLHACSDIRNALRNIKALLKPNGFIFINEAISSDIFLHCTFGLLEGWWLFNDRDVRLPGGPILSKETWTKLLEEEGFTSVTLPISENTSAQQQVIIAQSNGVVRDVAHEIVGEEAQDGDRSKAQSTISPHQKINKTTDVIHQTSHSINSPHWVRETVSRTIAKILAEVVAVDIEDIDYAEPFTALGVDSILIVKITNQLKPVFASVDSSLLFDCNSVDRLTNHFMENDSESVSALIEDQTTSIVVPNLEIQSDNTAQDLGRKINREESIIQYIRTTMSQVLQIDSDDISVSQSFESLGIDSILVVKLTNAIKQEIPYFENTLLFEYKTITDLATHLINDTRASNLSLWDEISSSEEEAIAQNSTSINTANLEKTVSPAQPYQKEKKEQNPSESGIAIIGINGRYPKANNLDEFWDNLYQGRNCIDVVPPQRWDWQEQFSAKGKGEGIYSKWGGFIDNPGSFDALFFGVSPREAEKMDPQERIFLECAYSTIEDAGYTPSSLAVEDVSTGVFVGVMNNTYQRQPSHWSVANRVSFSFDFNGPSFAVDTACSSSLTAIHVACESIRSGESDYAIAGGVNLIVDSEHFKGLTEMQMLSESNECRSFGANADGFVDGEGVGAVLLKPLAKAIEDGDHIYAVIRGTAINHGGRTNGYTVPSPRAQKNVTRKALKKSGLSAGDISYIEAHGTGTQLGDPIEFSGLTSAFKEDTSAQNFCALGSVKSNIGHCESAAGIAGLTKIILQMKHKTLVPSLHSKSKNPNINFDNSPFVIQQSASPWIVDSVENSGNSELVAGISSFGAGGANAHIVIENFEPTQTRNSAANQPVVCVFSAKTQPALIQRLNDTLTCLDKTTAQESRADLLIDFAYTLQTGREELSYRLATVVSSFDELETNINSYLVSLGASAETNTSSDEGLQVNNTSHQHISSTVSVFTNEISKRSQRQANSIESSIDEEEKQLIVSRYIEKRDFVKLAKLWTQGFSIDWLSLYTNKPSRISLPTYPFETVDYWSPVKFKQTSSLQVKAINTKIPEDFVAYREILKANTLDSKNSAGSTITSVPNNKPKQLLVYVLDNKHKQTINRAFESSYENIAFIYEHSQQGIETQIRTSGLNPSVDTKVLYLCSAERTIGNASSDNGFTDHHQIITLLSALKNNHYTSTDILLSGVCASADQYAYIDSWGALNQSLKPVTPGYQLRVLLLDSLLELNKSNLANSESALQRVLDLLSLELQQESPQSTSTIVYKGTERYTYSLEAYSEKLHSLIDNVNSDNAHSTIKPHGTYLITGGLGGIAVTLCNYLLKKYQATLILCGRSPLQGEKLTQLEKLQRLGGEVFYFCGDVTDSDALSKGINHTIQKFGVIDGVFHNAGVSNEVSVFDKTLAQCDQVINPKLKGALLLDELLANQPLDFVVYFSSVSAILGDLGACDYALANRFLLSYAEQREKRRLDGEVQGKSIAIAWPLMQAGGMKDSESKGSQSYLQSSGQQVITETDSMLLLEALLQQENSKIAVFKGNAIKIDNFLNQITGLKSTNTKVEQDGIIQDHTDSEETPSLKPTEKTTDILDINLSIQESLLVDLKAIVSKILKIDQNRIDIDETLSDFGFDSITLAEFATHLSGFLKQEITPAIFFSYATVSELSEHFATKYVDTLKDNYLSQLTSDGKSDNAQPSELGSKTAAASKDSVSLTIELDDQSISSRATEKTPENKSAHHATSINSQPEAIAVIGISGRFPDARNKEEMWQGLVTGKNSVSEIPKDRFDWQTIFGDPVKERGKTNGKWLGVIPGVDEFDPRFFEISPLEAEQMDPRQRLLLQESWRALEDAGYGKQHLKDQSIGMFVGVEQGDYQTLVKDGPLTANHDGILASRLAYLLDLSGPALAINTACSSGLVAAHEACMSLRAGECDTAIAAGVNVLLRPEAFIAMGQAGMLSETGQCQAFSEDANGMVPGEAVVAVVLKPLSAAERDGDPIYGVIQGSGINYDGKTNGITAPSGKAQARLLEKTYKKFNIDPATIEYIVTHGTGTRLGDPVEINALYDVYRSQDVPAANCALTSCKSNMGHTFAASGLVNLVNILMAMRHETIPATLYCETESNYIPWENSPFYVNKTNKSWPKAKSPRIGALSSFGMSGTNAHMVVQSYDKEINVKDLAEQPYTLLALSAKSRESLNQKIADLLNYLSTNIPNEADLTPLSFTLLMGRQHFAYRTAFVIQTIEDAKQVLADPEKAEIQDRVFKGEVDRQFTPQKSLLRFGEEQLALNAQESDSDTSKIISSGQRFQSLQTLADLYCQGYKLPWQTMFASKSRSHSHTKLVRLNLPGYPFLHEKYWVDVDHQDTREEPLQGSLHQHPLLQTNTSLLGKQKYTSQFTGNEFFLSEHVIHGDKILPGAAQIEMVLAAVQQSLNNDNFSVPFQLKNMTFQKPLVVSDQGITVEVSLNIISDTELNFEIASLVADEPSQIHSQGSINIVDDIAQNNGIAEGSNSTDFVATEISTEKIHSLIDACDKEISHSACYEVFTSLGLSYGPSFRALNQINVKLTDTDKPYLVAKLVPSLEENSNTANLFRLHPGTLDSALQACIGFILGQSENINAAAVPFSMDSIIAYGSLNAADSVYVIGQQLTHTEDKVQKYDLQVVSLDGEVIVEILGFNSRVIETPSLYQSSKNNNVGVGIDSAGKENIIFNNETHTNELVQAQGQSIQLLSPEWKSKSLVDSIRANDTEANVRATNTTGNVSVIFVGNGFEISNSRVQAELNTKLDASLRNAAADSSVTVQNITSEKTELAEHFTDIATQLLTELQSLANNQNSNSKDKHFIQLVLNEGNPFNYESFSAMLKCIEQEYRHVTVQTLQLPRAYSVETIVQSIINEWDTGLLDKEVLYTSNERLVLELTEQPQQFTGHQNKDNEKPYSPWVEGGVYLITGGLGGIGKVLVNEITTKLSAGTIVLLGRSSSHSDFLSEHKAALFNKQLSIAYYSTDISDANALQSSINTINQEFGPITSVLHCAGINKDNLFSKKSVTELHDVFKAKVEGLILLDKLTQDQPLDLFATFSSLSAIYGNIGQSDYACANSFMDNFIRNRTEQVEQGLRLGRSVSINWPLWQEGGMSVDDSTLRYLESHSGMTAISSGNAMSALYDAIACGKCQLAVQAYVNKTNQPMAQAEASNTVTVDETATSTGEINISSLQEKLKKALVTHISDQLKVKPSDIDYRAEFSEFGFDSVSLTVFGNTLNEQYDIELSPTVFFEFPTVNDLVDFLTEEYGTLLSEYYSLAFVDKDEVLKFSVKTQTSTQIVVNNLNQQPETQSTEPESVLSNENDFLIRKPEVNSINSRTEDIAIVGISGKFPEAENLEEFWQNLKQGKDCITEIPGERWDWDSLYGDSAREVNKTQVKHAGVISGIDEFDPKFFGISILEAESLDPQQRLLMTYVWKAIEDSGHAPESLSGSNTGIFIGTGNSGYVNQVLNAGVPLEAYSATSMAGSVGPNRMSFMLNIHGPSEPIETACSSSLVAVHRAVNAIHTGQCDQAIVGGINLLVSPESHISFDKAGMLAPDGRCKTFSKDANGYVRGEGVGIFMLKPLSHAEQDGDNIYAVIKGTAENHGGRANSLTSPNPRAQADLIKTALRNSGIAPNTIGYIEAHGTGTPLGDPIEIQGLKNAFSELSQEQGVRLDKASCRLGTVKTNIGHLELAAGAAGLMKVILQLKNKELVPSLHCNELNPYIDFSESPFSLIDQPETWSPFIDSAGNSIPRRAGVSSFGFGGVNAHIVLEEYVPSQAEIQAKTNTNTTSGTDSLYVIVLSAKTEEALDQQIQQLMDVVATSNESDLANIAYTLQVGRDAMDYRWSCIVNSLAELRELLNDALNGTLNQDSVSRDHIKTNREWLDLFSHDEDLQQAAQQWITKKKLHKISKYWVKGLPVEWDKLYSVKPKRLSLPSYPFAKQRCWIDQLACVQPAVNTSPSKGVKNHSQVTNQIQSNQSLSTSEFELASTDNSIQIDRVNESVKTIDKTTNTNTTENTANSGDFEKLLTSKVSYGLGMHLSKQLRVAVEEIDIDSEFNEFGLDSVSLTVFSNELAREYDVEISPTTLFEFPTIQKLSDYLVSDEREKMLAHFTVEQTVFSNADSPETNNLVENSIRGNSVKENLIEQNQSQVKSKPLTSITEDLQSEPIAIIGVSGCFPESPDLESFWENLRSGTDCITEIPNSRWDWGRIFGDPKSEKNQTNIKHAGIIQGIDEFDPLFFGISPREAAVMDPQQRLLMTYLWKVIEDAGYAPSALSGSNTGVFIGTGNSGYSSRLTEIGALVEGYSAACMVGSVGPNRMSHLLDLHGPSEPIETACSSSLVAIHRAMGSIRSGQCEQAIVGGVNVLVSPETHISFSKAGMLSEDGRCKTFSKDANGYVRGEGVGMLLLKPLSKAEQDGDHIYGLIRGSAENHGGRANSLTSPNPRAQADLIKTAIADSGIDPRTITYIEAHGTGTSLGDPIEIKGLKTAFTELEAERGQAFNNGFCQLGSVKSNIGHLELAAGVAGIIKVLLQMKHKTLAPSLHCEEQNPYIELNNTPFEILQHEKPWQTQQDESGNTLPRRAGVSSFGFGGVNAHVILEEYTGAELKADRESNIDTDTNQQPVAIIVSAKNKQSLHNQIAQLRSYIQKQNQASINLENLAFTLQVGRDEMNYRFACMVESATQLVDIFSEYLNQSSANVEAKTRFIEGKVKKRLLQEEANSSQLSTSVIESLLAAKNLNQLIQAWITGESIQWQRLYNQQPQRISLPTYAFNQASYWLDNVPVVESTVSSFLSDQSEPDSLKTNNNELHNLLQCLSRKEIDIDTALEMVVE